MTANSRREPKVRATHPLLRRRQAAQHEAPEPLTETPPASPLTAGRNDTRDTAGAAPAEEVRMRAPAAPSFSMPPAAKETPEARRVPLLKAAFRRPRQKDADLASPVEPAPVVPPRTVVTPEPMTRTEAPPVRNTAEMSPPLRVEPLRASESAPEEPPRNSARDEPPRDEIPARADPVEVRGSAGQTAPNAGVKSRRSRWFSRSRPRR